MFDNTKPNIILLGDNTDVHSMPKSFGIHKIAYTLRQAGFQVAVINHLHIFSVNEIVHLLKNLISEHTLFVGVSNFFFKSFEYNDKFNRLVTNDTAINSVLPHGSQYNQLIKDTIRNANHNCKLVLGGPTASDLPVFKDFDFVVIGYAELSVINLANHLLTGESLNKAYRSIYGPTIVNDAKADGYDFESSHMHYEDHDAILPGELLFLEVGRGCIFNCTFCAFPLNGKNKFDYIRNRDLIKAELLDNFNRFKVTRYVFVDDTFNDSVEKCKMIAEVSKELPFKLEYWAYIRLDLLAAHPETIDLLIESGLKAMFFGIETFNPVAAKAIRKGGSREKLLSTISYIKDKWGDSVLLQGSFVLGLPYEDMNSMNQTINYLLGDDNRLDSWTVQALRIRPPSAGVFDGFASDIDKNYKNYGYTDTDQNVNYKSNTPVMLWENEFTSFLEVDKLANQVVNSATNYNKKNGMICFKLAGLGLTVEEILKLLKNNSHKINRLKLIRATQYKKLLFKQLGIPEVKTNNLTWVKQLLKFQTFTQYLIERLKFSSTPPL